MKTGIVTILLVLFCALLGGFGQVLFKLASKDFSLDFFQLIKNWKLLLGLCFYAIATILFIFALKKGNLSILYPIIATSYVWVVLFSIIFLKETFPLYKWFGILLLLSGVYIIVK